MPGNTSLNCSSMKREYDLFVEKETRSLSQKYPFLTMQQIRLKAKSLWKIQKPIQNKQIRKRCPPKNLQDGSIKTKYWPSLPVQVKKVGFLRTASDISNSSGAQTLSDSSCYPRKHVETSNQTKTRPHVKLIKTRKVQNKRLYAGSSDSSSTGRPIGILKRNSGPKSNKSVSFSDDSLVQYKELTPRKQEKANLNLINMKNTYERKTTKIRALQTTTTTVVEDYTKKNLEYTKRCTWSYKMLCSKNEDKQEMNKFHRGTERKVPQETVCLGTKDSSECLLKNRKCYEPPSANEDLHFNTENGPYTFEEPTFASANEESNKDATTFAYLPQDTTSSKMDATRSSVQHTKSEGNLNESRKSNTSNTRIDTNSTFTQQNKNGRISERMTYETENQKTKQAKPITTTLHKPITVELEGFNDISGKSRNISVSTSVNEEVQDDSIRPSLNEVKKAQSSKTTRDQENPKRMYPKSSTVAIPFRLSSVMRQFSNQDKVLTAQAKVAEWLSVEQQSGTYIPETQEHLIKRTSINFVLVPCGTSTITSTEGYVPETQENIIKIDLSNKNKTDECMSSTKQNSMIQKEAFRHNEIKTSEKSSTLLGQVMKTPCEVSRSKHKSKERTSKMRNAAFKEQTHSNEFPQMEGETAKADYISTLPNNTTKSTKSGSKTFEQISHVKCSSNIQEKTVKNEQKIGNMKSVTEPPKTTEGIKTSTKNAALQNATVEIEGKNTNKSATKSSHYSSYGRKEATSLLATEGTNNASFPKSIVGNKLEKPQPLKYKNDNKRATGLTEYSRNEAKETCSTKDSTKSTSKQNSKKRPPDSEVQNSKNVFHKKKEFKQTTMLQNNSKSLVAATDSIKQNSTKKLIQSSTVQSKVRNSQRITAMKNTKATSLKAESKISTQCESSFSRYEDSTESYWTDYRREHSFDVSQNTKVDASIKANSPAKYDKKAKSSNVSKQKRSSSVPARKSVSATQEIQSFSDSDDFRLDNDWPQKCKWLKKPLRKTKMPNNTSKKETNKDESTCTSIEVSNNRERVNHLEHNGKEAFIAKTVKNNLSNTHPKKKITNQLHNKAGLEDNDEEDILYSLSKTYAQSENDLSTFDERVAGGLPKVCTSGSSRTAIYNSSDDHNKSKKLFKEMHYTKRTSHMAAEVADKATDPLSPMLSVSKPIRITSKATTTTNVKKFDTSTRLPLVKQGNKFLSNDATYSIQVSDNSESSFPLEDWKTSPNNITSNSPLVINSLYKEKKIEDNLNLNNKSKETVNVDDIIAQMRAIGGDALKPVLPVQNTIGSFSGEDIDCDELSASESESFNLRTSMKTLRPTYVAKKRQEKYHRLNYVSYPEDESDSLPSCHYSQEIPQVLRSSAKKNRSTTEAGDYLHKNTKKGNHQNMYFENNANTASRLASTKHLSKSTTSRSTGTKCKRMDEVNNQSAKINKRNSKILSNKKQMSDPYTFQDELGMSCSPDRTANIRATSKRSSDPKQSKSNLKVIPITDKPVEVVFPFKPIHSKKDLHTKQTPKSVNTSKSWSSDMDETKTPYSLHQTPFNSYLNRKADIICSTPMSNMGKNKSTRKKPKRPNHASLSGEEHSSGSTHLSCRHFSACKELFRSEDLEPLHNEQINSTLDSELPGSFFSNLSSENIYDEDDKENYLLSEHEDLFNIEPKLEKPRYKNNPGCGILCDMF